MRYIKKGKEPKSLAEYKKQKGAYFDGFKNKDDIRRQLLLDQGYLCAYCMRRIDIDNMKIEHWRPQRQGEDEHNLDFSIMLGVCKGNEGQPQNCTTCDTHRQEIPIKVNPLRQVDIDSIEYHTSDGRIFSTDQEINHDLNDTLNLNYDGENVYLCTNRKNVLKILLQQLIKEKKTGNWSSAILQKYLCFYENKDKTGKLRPYSGIAIWYLKKRLKK